MIHNQEILNLNIVDKLTLLTPQDLYNFQRPEETTKEVYTYADRFDSRYFDKKKRDTIVNFGK